MPKIFLSELKNRISGGVQNMIDADEKRYYDEIDALANEIGNDRKKRIVLLAGPSGSGKTTSANILKDAIVSLGRKAAVVSLDEFFKDKENYPLDEDGKPDFESIYALDIDTMTECIGNVVRTGSAVIPKFDFPNQRRSEKTTQVDVGKDGLLIVEGIHALNPIICNAICEGLSCESNECIATVFVSVSTGIKDDFGKEIISGIQIRLLRRLIRDHLYRGFNAKNTLAIWNSVLRGEQRNLYPYKPLAKYKINTFHAFEVFVYAQYIKDNLSPEINALGDSEYYPLFRTVMDLPGIDLKYVPETSLIKEFIPGGIYESIY